MCTDLELVTKLSAGGVWNGVVGGISISVTVLNVVSVRSHDFAKVWISESGCAHSPGLPLQNPGLLNRNNVNQRLGPLKPLSTPRTR